MVAAITNKMRLCHCVIIIAGVYSTHSKWINKEITIAARNFASRKPIVAVEPWGAERTSSVVKDNADYVVQWNTDSIITAIKNVC